MSREQSFGIAIVGLGLIGGSLAYALRGFEDCAITGYDTDAATLDSALQCGAIDRAAASLDETVKDADLVIFASGPESILLNMERCLPLIKPDAVVTDICGVKREILDFAEKHTLNYVGLHPMAGKEVGGFINADKMLFKGAGFILVLTGHSRQESVELLKRLSAYVGAGRIVINRADRHDSLIAYTSDLMHISAAALCVSYPEDMTMAHTAGAFRDCTRIARIDAPLWTSLLTKNADNVIPHLEQYIQDLTRFKNALERGDSDFLHDFLQKASDNKDAIMKL